MAKQTGLGMNFYVGGYDLSGDVNELSQISGPVKPLDMTDITLSAFARQGGQRDGQIDFKAFHDPTGAHVPLSALPVADVVASAWVAPLAVGCPVAAMNAKQVNYDPKRGTDGSLLFDVSTSGQGYGLEWGLGLTGGLRTDTAATNGAALDNGAGTSFGAQAYLHVVAFTGTSVDIAVQHSSDNVTWTTLIDFGSQSGIGGVRGSVANTATVNRYLRVSTVSGTFSSVTFACAVNRNPVAGVTF